MRKVGKRGFTLVELLIVIALIGVLAAALVATLNPIEQVNKARDARFKNDAAELLAAYERYYASAQTYPWVGLADDVTLNEEWGGLATFYGAGVCGSTASSPASNTAGECDQNGTLIAADELKPAFKGKTQFQNPGDELLDGLFIWKEAGTSGAVYVCFIPKSRTNRQKTTELRCLNTDGSGVPTGYARAGQGTCAAPTDPAADDWSSGLNSGDKAIFVCAPE